MQSSTSEVGSGFSIWCKRLANWYRCRTGHGPVVDLSKDAKNAELVSAVRLPLLPNFSLVVSGALTIGHGIFVVLEEQIFGRCCLPWTRVSTLWFSAILFKTLTWYHSSALVQGKDSNEKSIFEGKNVTGFSNAEEEAYGYSPEVSSRCTNAFRRERILTSATPLGYRLLVREQDQGTRGKV